MDISVNLNGTSITVQVVGFSGRKITDLTAFAGELKLQRKQGRLRLRRAHCWAVRYAGWPQTRYILTGLPVIRWLARRLFHEAAWHGLFQMAGKERDVWLPDGPVVRPSWLTDELALSPTRQIYKGSLPKKVDVGQAACRSSAQLPMDELIALCLQRDHYLVSHAMKLAWFQPAATAVPWLYGEAGPDCLGAVVVVDGVGYKT